MSSLRLIILLIGLVFIAVIYFWESIKQKRLQRKQTIKTISSEKEYPEIRVVRDQDDGNEYAGVRPELEQPLNDTKNTAGMKEQEHMVEADKESEIPELSHTANIRHEPETRDMFTEHSGEPGESSGQDTAANQDIDEDRIIALHVTALPTRAFNGNDLVDAVNDVGLEYGEMNVFHHFGPGDMRSDRPLFSLADMFEPGNFDLDKLDRHSTRGLTLFFCLPSRVDGQVVFELMLNTAQRLAQRLGGEIRGPAQDLIDDEQITEIRNKINQHTYV